MSLGFLGEFRCFYSSLKRWSLNQLISSEQEIDLQLLELKQGHYTSVEAVRPSTKGGTSGRGEGVALSMVMDNNDDHDHNEDGSVTQ